MSNLGTLWITLSAKTADFRKQLKTSADKISALSNQFKSISIAAGATSAALTGISVVAVRAASNFEKSMIRVKAISQANDEQFAALKGRALELGATTEHSAQAAADGMGFMAMAGIQVNDIIKAMPSVLQLATAGQMDLARAADITTNIMKGMGMEVDQLGKANDVLVSTFTGSNVSLEMLGESFKYVGPVALSAGVGFEEVAAMIGGLGNAGIQGSMAGTTLRMAIARLIKPTAEVSEALDRLRINVQDSSGRLLPMVDIVRQLEEKGAQTADIMSIFGLRAGPGMASLIQQGSTELERFTQRLRDSGGIASRIQSETLNTFSGQLKILKSAVEGLAIAFGDALLPVLKPIIGFFVGILQSLNRMPAWMKSAIAVSVALAGALAGIVAVGAGLLALLPAIMAGWTALMAVMGGTTLAALWPVVAVIAAIAATAAGVILMIGLLKKAWETDFLGMRSAVIGLRDGFVAIVNGIKDSWDWLITKLVDAWDWFKETIASGVNNMIGLLNRVLPEKMQIAFSSGDIADGVASGVKDAADHFVAASKDIGEFFVGGAKNVGGFFVDGAKGVVDAFKTGLDTIKGVMSTGGGAPTTISTVEAGAAIAAGGAVAPVMGGGIGGGGVASGAAAEGILPGVPGAINQTTEAFRNIGNMVLSKTGEVGDFISSAIEGFKGGVGAGLLNMGLDLLMRTEAFKKIMEVLNQMLPALAAILEPLIAWLEPIVMIFGDLVNILQASLIPILDILNPVFMVVARILQGVALALGTIFLGLGTVWNAILSFFQKIVKVFIINKKREAKWIQKLEDAKADTDAMRNSLRKMSGKSYTEEGTTDNLAEGLDNATDGANGFADAADKATEALTNVPSGYKIAAARFASTQAIIPMGGMTFAAAGAGGGLSTSIGVVNLYGINDPETFWNELQVVIERENNQQTGSPTTSGSAGGGVSGATFASLRSS